MFDVPTLKIKARSGIYATGQERVLQILETAVDILIHDGFPAVTLREIARRMGIRVSAISHYYSSREDLILDVLSGVLSSYEEFFETFRTPSDEPPEARLRSFIAAVLDDILTLKTTRLFPELWALASRDDNVARMVDAIYIRSRVIQKRFIAALNPGLDARTLENLALYITASLEGLTVFAGHGKPWAGEMEHLKRIACDTLIAAVKAARPDPAADPHWQAPTLLDTESYGRLIALDD
ncbi:MAG TPA: TetR/AcrR family transcriptional regulator [Novosphingobium sp.]|nr:TetR/AcrR family transcriptional regulator [Novosphingobium sp.]